MEHSPFHAPDDLVGAKNEVRRRFLPDLEAVAYALGPLGQEADANVIGVGIGPKETDDHLTNESAVRVYVRTKIPRRHLSERRLIPDAFDGIPTDVVALGDVFAQQAVQSWRRFSTIRPLMGGISVGHGGGATGTLGCIVRKNGQAFLLSNNHVIADSNGGVVGDPVVQPGRLDDGAPAAVATLADFEPLRFDGPDNALDAAIALIDEQHDVAEEIVEIGRTGSRVAQAQIFQSVRKHGRTTGHTIGVIVDRSADITVRFGQRSARFVGQIGIRGVGADPFSRPGDSGSLIVDGVTRDPVALLFAGSPGQTFATPIQRVLSRFEVAFSTRRGA